MRRLIRLHIDTQALRANLAILRQRAPRSRVMAVIKANAYGHGLVSTALALAEADAFAVARIEEAVQLRAAGVRQPLLLLEGVYGREQLLEAAALQADLVVHNPLQLALLQEYRGAHRFSLWVKIDTGMNRLGFRPEQFAAVWQRLQQLTPAPLQLRAITHFSRADELDSDASAAQLARFWPLVQSLGVELSIANSAGILAHPASHVHWVRPGLALYGVSPFADRIGSQLGLKAAMTLESTVLTLREVAAGESVGYGARWRATRPSRVAIVAGGYGDGLLCSLPDGAPVLVNGRRARLVGRVSMDMSAVDVTDLEHVPAVGDAVELWGHQLPVEEVARHAGTIPYELLCAVSQRVPVELF
ncbi:MAG: alanine racemase [Steroidobacteraceae bacterium]